MVALLPSAAKRCVGAAESVRANYDRLLKRSIKTTHNVGMEQTFYVQYAGICDILGQAL
jgi:hypothetical protein